jgi:hypothetical protein
MIFDVVSEDRFKFAVLDVANDQILIGHFDAKSGWTIDSSIDYNLKPGQTYEVSILISGSTVAIEVDGVSALSHAYNGVAVDGQAGLLVKGGQATFDTVTIATDDPALAIEEAPAALRASQIGDGAEVLAQKDMQAIFEEAIHRLMISESLTASQVQYLEAQQFTIADLEGDLLASESNGIITIDTDAAGNGWFVDETPQADEEFHNGDSELAGGNLAGQMDLLSVAMHELGHSLAYDHVSDGGEQGFMTGMLDPNERLGLYGDDGDDIVINQSKDSEAKVYHGDVGEFITRQEADLLDLVRVSEANNKGLSKAADVSQSRRVNWTVA